MNYTISIKLNSDTIIGSAESFGSIIDTDIIFDELGLPYIPAKRVKGIMRNAAKDLAGFAEILAIESTFTLENIEKLFGMIGDTRQRDEFCLSNLYLQDYELIVDWLRLLKRQSNLITVQSVLQNFTTLRKQTAMDEEKPGIALKHSLRVSRVLKRDNLFIGSLSLSDDIAKEYESILGLIACYTTSMGTKRNRGFGDIELDITSTQSLKQIMKSKLGAMYDTQN